MPEDNGMIPLVLRQNHEFSIQIHCYSRMRAFSGTQGVAANRTSQKGLLKDVLQQEKLNTEERKGIQK